MDTNEPAPEDCDGLCSQHCRNCFCSECGESPCECNDSAMCAWCGETDKHVDGCPATFRAFTPTGMRQLDPSERTTITWDSPEPTYSANLITWP